MPKFRKKPVEVKVLKWEVGNRKGAAMGDGPLLISVENWQLEVEVNDFGTHIRLHVGTHPRTTHYMQLNRDEGAKLQEYLYRNQPLSV